MAEIKFDITEEQVFEAVKAVVREELAHMDEWGDVRELVKGEMKKAVAELIAEETKDKFDEIARQAVEEHVAEPFTLDDGWGYSRTTYASYGDFVRAKLHEKFEKDSWSVKREFENQVKAKVDAVWKEYRDDAVATAMAKVEALKAVD